MPYKDKEKQKQYRQEWRNKNKEKIRKAQKKHQKKYKLKHKYNLTLEDYDQMFEAQNGVCAICGGVNKGRRLDVDHNHLTEEIRGLLCNKCNQALGLLRTDKYGISLLQKAIKYIDI